MGENIPKSQNSKLSKVEIKSYIRLLCSYVVKFQYYARVLDKKTTILDILFLKVSLWSRIKSNKLKSKDVFI